MRELESHKVNEANNALTIRVVDEPGPGGACHAYMITGIEGYVLNPSAQAMYDAWVGHQGKACALVFQNGAIKEAGVNGITHEALLAVLTDRLTAFQGGPYACKENGEALYHLIAAAMALAARTNRRLEAGVEGTMALDPVPEARPLAGPAGDPVHKGKPASGNPIMRFFTYDHLKDGFMRDVSKMVADLSAAMEASLPAGAEKSAGMRKLLEAKDCFVRAALPAA